MGGDGYLGWSLALALANRTENRVVIVDNLIKRKWESSVGVAPLVELTPPQERIALYEKVFKKRNLEFVNVDLRCYDDVHAIVREYLPKAIINAAQQPSAPFSMMSPGNAKLTFENNSDTNLNVLWAISQVSPEIKYIKLGSAGSYLSIDADYIPKAKVDFRFQYKGEERKILNTWLPMQASDFYHQSKANAFLLSDLCASMWGLKVITVHQSTIFGHTIPENASVDRHGLMTRYNYDHIFGTVINRFACQAVLNHPLTVYGDGSQKTGVISLTEAVDNFIRLLEVDVEPGKHMVEHNYTHKISINRIASELRDATGVEIEHIENPRVEAATALEKRFEEPAVNSCEVNDMAGFKREMSRLLEFTTIYKGAISSDQIMPKVKWAR